MATLIENIFISPDLSKEIDMKIISEEISDHYPVLTTCNLDGLKDIRYFVYIPPTNLD